MYGLQSQKCDLYSLDLFIYKSEGKKAIDVLLLSKLQKITMNILLQFYNNVQEFVSNLQLWDCVLTILPISMLHQYGGGNFVNVDSAIACNFIINHDVINVDAVCYQHGVFIFGLWVECTTLSLKMNNDNHFLEDNKGTFRL